MLIHEQPKATFELCGQTVIVSALKGADVDEFYRLMDADMRKAYAFAFHRCVTYADGRPVYATPEEALNTTLCEWSAVREAWLRVNWPEKNV